MKTNNSKNKKKQQDRRTVSVGKTQYQKKQEIRSGYLRGDVTRNEYRQQLRENLKKDD